MHNVKKLLACMQPQQVVDIQESSHGNHIFNHTSQFKKNYSAKPLTVNKSTIYGGEREVGTMHYS